jgi:hypothetical protein
MSIARGLKHLGFTPNEDFVLQDDGAGAYIKEWLSGSPQPSDDEIATAQTAHGALAYARTRESAYPSIGDQLDMLWHAIDSDNWTAAKVKTTDFYTQLKTVKDANPKP